MKIECGFCKCEFTLDKIHIKREQTKENPIVKGILDAMLGVKTSEMVYKHFIYCPRCHQKIARFDY